MSDSLERRTYGEIRLDPDGEYRLRGYAIRFNKLSEDLGGFKELVRPEAVDRTLREALDVRALIDHDSSRILGRTRAGTLKLKADSRGLAVAIDPPNTTAARDILESVERGDVTGMSFAFRTLTDDWRMEDGLPIRELIDIRIRDVSIVTFPAYPDTDVAVAQRSLLEFTGPSKHSREYWLRQHRQRLAL